MPLHEFMDKYVSVTTDEDEIITGFCCGVYGSVDCQEDYGRDETAIDIDNGNDFIMLFESDIKEITVLQKLDLKQAI